MMERLGLFLLVLVLWGSPACCPARAAAEEGGRDATGLPLISPKAKLIWGRRNPPPGLRFSPPRDAYSSPVSRAAEVALQYFNHRFGSPTSLRVLGHLEEASLRSIPGVGHKYILKFSTKDLQTGQNQGICFATVIYQKNKPRPAVEIICKNMRYLDQRLQKDFHLYLSILDSSEHFLDGFSALAFIGSSYIAWEKSTENVNYSMTQVKNVKLWKRTDESLEFDYSVLLDNNLSESLSCHMRIVWKLGKKLKVKYDCSPEEGSAEGSGKFGSASGFLVEPESNF